MKWGEGEKTGQKEHFPDMAKECHESLWLWVEPHPDGAGDFSHRFRADSCWGWPVQGWL